MKLVVLFAVLGMIWVTPVHANELAISDAYAREMPPSVMSTAVYLTLKNTSDDRVTLLKVSSPQAARVVVHENIKQDDMMRMRPIDRLEIAAHSQIDFTPGGYHLMIMGLTQLLQEGSNLDLEFLFDDGQIIKAIVPVLNTADSNKHSNAYQHMEMDHSNAHKNTEMKVQQ